VLHRLSHLIAAMGLALVLGICCASADEYRVIPVTAWNAGFLDQADVDKLLGVPGVATSKGDVRNANCNAIIAQVRRRADVCYPSGMGEPYMSGLSPSNFNALQAIPFSLSYEIRSMKRFRMNTYFF
jgi:uncharacterized lipoprotein YddW (UPF0748 family)